MKKNFLFSLTALLISSLILFSCKKDEEDDTNNDDSSSTDKNYALVIETGAQSIEPNQTLAYSAILVDKDGNTSSASVNWTVSPDSIGAITSAGVFSTSTTGNATITASIQKDGNTYTASVPIGVYAPSLFAVAPSAILYEEGGELQLEPIYFTTESNVTYSYNSSDDNIATVNSSGLVSFVSAGSCQIEVTASTLPDNPFIVPVVVISVPDVELPVTRVELNKNSTDLFKTETEQLTATAYNPDGEVSNASFTWKSLDTDIATVNSSGLITPQKTGKTYVQATCQGIMAQAEVLVNPDTVVIVTPFYKDMSPGDTQQFTATAYKNERSGLNTTYNVTFNWFVPDYGPGFEMFNVATVDNNGNVTIKQDAMIGMATLVMAYDASNEYVAGGAMIMIGMGGWTQQ